VFVDDPANGPTCEMGKRPFISGTQKKVQGFGGKGGQP